MKINGKIENVMILTKKESVSSKDASLKFYTLGIMANDELGELSCTEEAFNSTERGKYYNCEFVYNSEAKFNPVRIVSAVGIKG